MPWLLARLESHGLLESAAPAEPSRVSVVGGGPIAAALTATLTGVTVQTIDPVSHAAALISTHGAEPALTVLAGPTAEPDRTLTDALFAAGRPHLLVRLEPDRAVVGPLVVPGRTPCVRCLDLSRCRLDAAWPHLLAQLCREAAEPDPVLLAWVATIASVQIRAWLAGDAFRRPPAGRSSSAGRTSGCAVVPGRPSRVRLPGTDRLSGGANWPREPTRTAGVSLPESAARKHLRPQRQAPQPAAGSRGPRRGGGGPQVAGRIRRRTWTPPCVTPPPSSCSRCSANSRAVR